MDRGRLEDRLSEFIERRERGEPLDPEDFARDHGEHGVELLAALRALAATEALFPSSSSDLPARIGPYRVLGEIGRGGMGRVLEVADPRRPGTTLALKLLHVSLVGQPRALERFRREGKALERLRHPWIVRVHEASLLDERPYLAMERVEGTSLAEHLRQARERVESGMRPREALHLPGEGDALERSVRLVARLARAMAAAHREGVLHRDLNPRNVLVRPGGEPVVIDFGLMRASGAPTLTGSGDLLGTPQYMAPEQARGERVDERTDVFGLGAILLELLTLQPPRAAEETLLLVRRAATRPLEAPRGRGLGLPRELVIVLRRATSFFPRWRYASCEALATDLERVLEGEAIRAHAPGSLQRTCEFLRVHWRGTLVLSTLLVALASGLALRALRKPEERHAQLIEGMNAVFLPWLDGDLEGARRALTGFLEEEPGAPFADFLLALVEDDLTRASSDPATRALLDGERARRAGDPRLALQRFRTAWDLQPDFPMVVFLQGLAAEEAGELEPASHALERTVHFFGGTPALHAALARCYEGLERPADAARALQALLALRPEAGEAWLALARARARTGEGQAALAAAARASALLASPGPLEDLALLWEREGHEILARDLRSRSER